MCLHLFDNTFLTLVFVLENSLQLQNKKRIVPFFFIVKWPFCTDGTTHICRVAPESKPELLKDFCALLWKEHWHRNSETCSLRWLIQRFHRITESHELEGISQNRLFSLLLKQVPDSRLHRKASMWIFSISEENPAPLLAACLNALEPWN